MDEIQKNKLERFMMDEKMSNTVYLVLQDAFLRNKGQRDVQVLAAERIALDLLDNAWTELSKYKKVENSVAPILRQVGL